MTRSLEEQIRSLAQRNVDDAAVEPTDERIASLGAYPVAGHESGHRRLVLAAACVILLIVAGVAALALDRRGGDGAVAAGSATHVLPPAGATGIAGWLVPEGSTIDFTLDTGDYQLTQIDVPADGSTSHASIIEMLHANGAQVRELDGVGTVYVVCAGVPASEVDGTSAAIQRDGVAGLEWFANGQMVSLLPRTDQLAAVPCNVPDGTDNTYLLEVAQSLRSVDQAAWDAFIASNDFVRAPGDEPTATTTGASVEDPTAFCDLIAATAEVPEAYVGSPQHVADLSRLAAVAPTAVRDKVEAVLAYVSSGAVDPTKPDTQLITNWPAALQSATAALSSYSASTCGVNVPG